MSKQGKSLTVEPLADRVLIKRVETMEEKTASGIIIPDTAQKEKSKVGLVVSVGKGRHGEEGDLIPMSLKAGQKVIFNSGWDNEVKVDDSDDEYFLVKESDVLAVIK